MNKQTYQDQIVWIIGASSGIGLALVHTLSARGAILALSARSEDILNKLKHELGDRHQVFALDVSDSKATVRVAQTIHATFGRIDRVVFLAAAYTPMQICSLDITATKKMIDINLTGAFNLVHAVLPILKAQKNKNQLALCGSVAGYLGLPQGQPYSATKAAIINLAESLYADCKDTLDIKLINPGFVRTSLTDKNNFDMPMIIEPEKAAKAIADGLTSRHFEIHFPKKFTIILKILSLLPYGLSLQLTKHIK